MVSPRWKKRKRNMAANYRLKAARVLKGLTQLQLAEKLGLEEHEISRLETGRSTPDGPTKQRIAEVLGKPAFELFDC
jgi:transcriptional regulator with XRE-family HTH domain